MQGSTEGEMSATATLIDAMEHMDDATHALVIVALKDGCVEIRNGGMPDWQVVGLLSAALKGWRDSMAESELIEDDSE